MQAGLGFGWIKSILSTRRFGIIWCLFFDRRRKSLAIFWDRRTIKIGEEQEVQNVKKVVQFLRYMSGCISGIVDSAPNFIPNQTGTFCGTSCETVRVAV